MMIIRTAAAVLFLVVLVILVIPVVFLAMLFGLREPLVGIGKGAMRVCRALLGLPIEATGDRRGTETGPCVFMSNHMSLLDGPLLFLLIRKPVRVIMKTSIFRIPIAGLGMRFVGFVPVDRKGASGGREAISRAAEMIRKKGYSFLIFPEGTRSLSGELGPFRRGGFFLAREAGVPIVPVTIRGTFELMPKGRAIPGKGKIRVFFHPPVPAPESAATDLTEWMNAVRERLLSAPE